MQDSLSSPTRAEVLFADSAEYDDAYETLSASMNGMDGSWIDGSRGTLSKPFQQPGLVSGYEGELDEEGDTPSCTNELKSFSSCKHFDPTWRALLNGNFQSIPSHNDVRDSWESLADENSLQTNR